MQNDVNDRSSNKLYKKDFTFAIKMRQIYIRRVDSIDLLFTVRGGCRKLYKKVWTHEQGSVPPHNSLLSGLKALYLLHFAFERG